MRTLIIVLCILFSYSGYCQETAFVVIDVTGTVTYGKNKKALIGSTITDNETIVVGKASSVTLACNNSGYARFNTPGKFVANSTTYCKAAPDAAFAKLCKFAWHQFADKESNDDWRNHLDNLGAASRGVSCFARIDANISNIYYYQGDFTISATPNTPGTELYLKVYKDANSAPFLQLPMTDNKFPLAELKKKLKEHWDYYWNLAPKDAFCGESNSLHMLNKRERDSIVALATKTVNTNISNKAERQYLLGVSLENMHLFADAFACYKEAVKLSPADKRYNSEVAAFKKRYGMK